MIGRIKEFLSGDPARRDRDVENDTSQAYGLSPDAPTYFQELASRAERGEDLTNIEQLMLSLAILKDAAERMNRDLTALGDEFIRR